MHADAEETWVSADATRGDAWRLALTSEGFTLTTAAGVRHFSGGDAARLSVSGWMFGRSLVVTGAEPLRLRGVRPQDADSIRAAVRRHVARARLVPMADRASVLRRELAQLIASHADHHRWIPREAVDAVLRNGPPLAWTKQLEQDAVAAGLSDYEREALAFWGQDPWESVRAANERILDRELSQRQGFFAQVEKSPLTQEQARAVVTFDNRVRVIAAAGSGKTSVMVARAAYAIDRGFVTPDRILMLAFNSDAASELQHRVAERLGALGLPSDGIRATTFHAFGRSVIGKATGRKPSVAAWVENGDDVAKVGEIVAELRRTSPRFRFQWDAFRFLHGRLSATPEGGATESNARRGRPSFRTYRGETVRSEGERLIADWLYLNGVDYRYEQPYAHEVSDSDHAQYRPDFFYPQIDVWHEHWALRADGTPPDAFAGYAEAMAWKRATHRRFGTTLLETTWHEIVNLQGFERLAAELRDHGLQLDWNPERPTRGAQPIEHDRLCRLLRTFMCHVKGSSLTAQDIAARLGDNAPFRTRLFLDLYWQVHERWQDELRTTQAIDFDDMLLQAADLLDHDPRLADFDLILVDEFQDTSHARARLIRALTAGPGKHLLAVGDDWQAINRFAGADLHLLTHFEDTFGPAETLYLQTTFRNPQALADVASRFITRNPAQLRKTVTSHRPDAGPAVTILRVADRTALPDAIRQRLAELAADDHTRSVDILGRYRRDRHLLPNLTHPGLQVTFRTVHAAKGLEADHIILPNLTSGTYGFPSTIDDDPVLALAMTGDDGYPHSEERRLFYVALTRARRAVTVLTITGQESPFIEELLGDPHVTLRDLTPTGPPGQPCPECGQGTLVPRTGPYGAFLGCTQFPSCRHTTRTSSPPAPHTSMHR